MDVFKLPRSTLDKLPTALLKGVLIALLEEADENGVLAISIRGFAKKIGLEYQPLRTALKHIYSNALANATPNATLTQRLTQITITDIECYKVSVRSGQRKANATPNASINAVTTQQKTKKFTPPTESDVAQYVTEKGYHFDPKQFVSFYQSKGWMIGKNPMRDWKAACRTWELEWQKKHGKQFYYQIGKPTLPGQADRYSELERATETILQQSGNIDSYFNDKGRYP